MSGKNQHFIPQFLQREFACVKQTNTGFCQQVKSPKQKQEQVWVFEKKRKPYFTNVRNKGAERFFYGTEDSELDKTITDAERKYSNIVNSLRKEISPISVKDPLIPELVTHLFVRTKHFRTSVKNLSGFRLNMVENILESPEDMVQLILNYLWKNPNEVAKKINKSISDLPLLPAQKIEIQRSINQNPTILLEGINNSFSNMPNIHAEVRQSILSVRNNLADTAKSAHIKYLSESIVPKKRVEQLKSLNWFLFVQVQGSYILGDAGSLCSSSNNQYKLLLSADEDLQHILLPISGQHLLIGSTADSLIEPPDVEDINYFSAALSEEYFIANQNTEQEQQYAEKIGTKNSVLSTEQLSIIEDDIRAKWMDK
jgi:hypothetical protein